MPADSQLAAEKAAWRKTLRSRRASIDGETAGRAAARIREATLALPEVERAKGVLACLSFGDEVDTWHLVEALLKAGRRIFVPRVAPGDERQLRIHPYPCALETLSFGLRQPPAGEPELPAAAIDATIDVALIAGLGFDRRGYRLGYGRGYFDRFLADHRSLAAVGLAYETQIVDRLPSGPNDVPMDVVVIEGGVLRFAAGPS